MSILDGITNYAVANKGSEEGYRHVREAAVKVFIDYPVELRRDLFEEQCRVDEDEFLEINYSGDPKAKHESGKRKGEWKYRTLLPHAYNTAKNSLAKGLEAGLNPDGLGKSDLEKQTRTATQVRKSPRELVIEAVDLLFKRYDALTAAEDKRECERLLNQRIAERGI